MQAEPATAPRHGSGPWPMLRPRCAPFIDSPRLRLQVYARSFGNRLAHLGATFWRPRKTKQTRASPPPFFKGSLNFADLLGDPFGARVPLSEVPRLRAGQRRMASGVGGSPVDLMVLDMGRRGINLAYSWWAGLPRPQAAAAPGTPAERVMFLWAVPLAHWGEIAPGMLMVN